MRVGRKLINPFGIQTDGVPPYRETRAYVSAGTVLLQQLVVKQPTPTIASTPDARAAQSQNSDAIITTTGIRKSISYAADIISSDLSAPTATTPRSISYQSR